MRRSAKVNLDYLAYELANNYYMVSSLDVYRKVKKGEENKIDEKARFNKRKEVFPKGYPIGEKIKIFSKKNDHSKSELLNTPSRNILVIGAGCTFNAFKNIPLGNEAKEIIQKEITVARVRRTYINENGEAVEGFENLSFNYFTQYLIRKELYKDTNTDYKKTDIEQLFDEFLDGELNNEGSLLSTIRKKYLAEYNKLKLLDHKYDRERGLDFENTLKLLSDLTTLPTVRNIIQKIYNCEHGPTLFYHVVAHLFKYRCIDVIINFNFDELLDQVLDEELSPNSYDKILSDGDCKPLNQISFEGRLRQPLYIKPHGTASHKSTLRFTKDHYYDLPMDIRKLLSELITCKESEKERFEEESTKRINLIVVGFNMESIEFNEILNSNLPPLSQVFHFSYDSKSDSYSKKYKKLFIDKRQDYPDIYPICYEELPKETYRIKSLTSLGNSFHRLFCSFQKCFDKNYTPRDIYKHLLICEVFGNTDFWEIAYHKDDPKHSKPKQIESEDRCYPKKYFNSADYFKDRIVIEVLVQSTFNKGYINPLLLMDGQIGRYYSDYYKRSSECTSFQGILEGLGFSLPNSNLFENTRIKTVLLEETNSITFIEKFGKGFDHIFDEITSEKGPISDILKKYLLGITEKKERLKQLLLAIYSSNNTKIHSEFNNYRYHIFQKFSTTDLISTDLANDLHFSKALDLDVEAICITADNAYQFYNFLELIVDKTLDVMIILQGDYTTPDEIKRLESIHYERFKDKYLNHLKGKLRNEREKQFEKWVNNHLRICFLPINSHNNHMTLFFKKKTGYKKFKPVKGMYFYKWGLSQKIDPVQIEKRDNLEFLVQQFKDSMNLGEDMYKELEIDFPTPSWL